MTNSTNEKELLNKKIIHAIENKKGEDIVVIDLENIENSICDYFIICHGTSGRQVEAIANSIDEKVKQDLDINPWNTEGYKNAEWIVLDYIDSIVHIFLEEKRHFYQLEKLWADAEQINIETKY